VYEKIIHFSNIVVNLSQVRCEINGIRNP